MKRNNTNYALKEIEKQKKKDRNERRKFKMNESSSIVCDQYRSLFEV